MSLALRLLAVASPVMDEISVVRHVPCSFSKARFVSRSVNFSLDHGNAFFSVLLRAIQTNNIIRRRGQ